MTYNLGEKMKRHVKPKLHDEEKDLARRVEISKKKPLFIMFYEQPWIQENLSAIGSSFSNKYSNALYTCNCKS